MAKFFNVFTLMALLSVISCSTTEDNGEPKVTIPIEQNRDVRTEIGDSVQSFQVVGSESLLRAIQAKEFKAVGTKRIRNQSLTVSFPKKLLNENFVFGGVVTQVSDKENAALGNLKLSDLPPIFVKPVLSVEDDQFGVELRGCLEKCDELSPQETVVSIPVVALDEKNDRVVLDLATLGDKLNLIKLLDPKGEYTKLKTKTSEVIAVDFSGSTLVFDVKVTMAPLEVKSVDPVGNTEFVVRWYLRLSSVFNPSFVARDKTEGVGFFMTERSRFPKIIRHGLTQYSSRGTAVKYFLKNIPEEHKESFRAAFEAWNEKFTEIAGHPLLRYEFVDAEDPRSKYLVAGDVRFNILEWDLINEASYGGLGPSIANQFTGEILSSNVLIQGPRILEIYQKWFKVSERVKSLKSQGLVTEAQKVIKEFIKNQGGSVGAERRVRYDLVLNRSAGFKVHSQSHPYEDPAFQKEEFELIPDGVTYEQYMRGYFMDMVAHELGHNLGLRHNFKGNLSAAEGQPEQGKVSASIMEYLGRPFRYLDEIGVYDLQALKYGYLGQLPEEKEGFCTDEDVPDLENPQLSAECSRDDATVDPFGYFLTRLERATDLIIARGSVDSSVWKPEEMATLMESTVQGLAFYATSATKMGQEWKQFFNKPGRPQDASAIENYVQLEIDRVLHPKDLDQVLSQKSAASQELTRLNLLEFEKKILEVRKKLIKD